MWRKFAVLGFATAAVMVLLWLFFPNSELQRLPQLPAAPTPNYVEKRRMPPPPPPPPPTWEEFVAKVNRMEPQKPGNRSTGPR